MGREMVLPIEPRPSPGLRLFCLPCAGGSAGIFRRWQRGLPQEIEVWALEPPGRGRRLLEAPLGSIDELARAGCDAVEAALDVPFALLGHSMGGVVALEMARELERRGRREPELLITACSAAPRTRRTPSRPLHVLSDHALVRELRRLNGTPSEVLGDEEMLELLLPAIRADFQAYELYARDVPAPIAAPILALGAADDAVVRPEELEGWPRETHGACRIRIVPGDHFAPSSLPAAFRNALLTGIAWGLGT